MKNLFLLFLIFAPLTISCNHSNVKRIIVDIDSIGKCFVPDVREGIGNVSVAVDGGVVVVSGEVDQEAHKSAVIACLSAYGYGFVDSINVLPDTSTLWNGLINNSFANLRSQPRHSSELVSQATMGTPVVILKKKGGWMLVKTPDSYIAWVTSSSVSLLDSQSIVQWRNSRRLIVVSRMALVHDVDNRSVVADVVQGNILCVSGEKDNLFFVVLPDGRHGVVAKDDAVLFDRWLQECKADGLSLMAMARQFTGLPYLWGGTTPYGFDCSGFVKHLYFMCGVVLSRDASQQIRYGVAIDKSKTDSFEPGDLLFFGDDGRGTVTHVGMSLGGSEFIHQSGMVKINSFDVESPLFSRYYVDNLVGVRRIVGVSSQKGIMAVANHEWYVGTNSK